MKPLLEIPFASESAGFSTKQRGWKGSETEILMQRFCLLISLLLVGSSPPCVHVTPPKHYVHTELTVQSNLAGSTESGPSASSRTLLWPLSCDYRVISTYINGIMIPCLYLIVIRSGIRATVHDLIQSRLLIFQYRVFLSCLFRFVHWRSCIVSVCLSTRSRLLGFKMMASVDFPLL